MSSSSEPEINAAVRSLESCDEASMEKPRLALFDMFVTRRSEAAECYLESIDRARVNLVQVSNANGNFVEYVKESLTSS